MLLFQLDTPPQMDSTKFWLRNLLIMLGSWTLLMVFMQLRIIFRNPSYLISSDFAGFLLYGLMNFLVFYVVSLFIAKRFLVTKQYLKLLMAILAVEIVAYFVKLGVGFLVYDYSLKGYEINGAFSKASYIAYFVDCFVVSGFAIILGLGHRGAIDWIKTERMRRELEREKQLAELSFLKMQMNPHFLFNSLNNLYSLSVLEKSEKTGEGILKLSNLMRYMLYEKEDSNNQVELLKEVEQLNGLIDLQQLRHDGKAQIKFEIEGHLTGYTIAPLILLPMLENAFKHGILNQQDRPVLMRLVTSPGQIDFTLQNYINNFQKDKTGGVGLVNVKKRLDLLYPKRHQLLVEKTDDIFQIHLTLHLQEQPVKHS